MSYSETQVIEIASKEQGMMLHAVCDGEVGRIQIYTYDNNGDMILHLDIKVDGDKVEANVFRLTKEGMV